MKLNKYSIQDLEVLYCRFKNFEKIALGGNARAKLLFELKANKPIFQDFSFVNEHWEYEILDGGDSAIVDAIQSVLTNITIELSNRK